MNPISGGRIVVGSLVVVLLIAGSVGFATSAGATVSSNPSDTNAVAGSWQSTAVTDADDSDRHVNPTEYDEDGELSDVRAWLAQQLADQLRNSTDALERGEYDAARAHLDDDEYQDQYDEYASVVHDTQGYDREGPAALPDAFIDAREDLQTFIDALENYEATLEEYERAQTHDDEASAFDLALELDGYAADAGEATERLQPQFETMETVAGADLGDGPAVVGELHDDVQAEQAAIRDEQFAETTITAAGDADTVTPTDTVTLTGTIGVDDDWPEDHEHVTIVVNDAPQTVPIVDDPQTDGVGIGPDGEYVLEYRPDPLSVTTDELRVEYVPAPSIGHLPSETTSDVAVESLEPTLSVEGPNGVAYGDTVLVTGDLTVGDVPVDDVPITVTLDDTELATLETEDGSFGEPVSIPAFVPDGERELVVSLDVEDRAIESVSDADSIRVHERESRVTLYSSETATGQLHVEGAVTAAGGDPIGDQPIRLAVDGEYVGNLTTASDGSFEDTIAAAPDGDNTTVTATYEGEGTNLASTQTSTAVETTAQVSWFENWSVVAPVVAGFIVLGGLLIAIWRLLRYYRSRRIDDGGFTAVFDDGSTQPSDSDSVGSDGGTFTARGTPGPDSPASDTDLPVSIGPSHSHELLTQASTQLSGGQTNEAIQSAYVAVRMELQSLVPDGQSLTHWEFHEQYSGPHAEALGEITEQYERAAFGFEEVPQEEASEVVVSARLLVEGMSEDRVEDGLDGIVFEE